MTPATQVALNFTPLYHAEAQPGQWTRIISPGGSLHPHASMERERLAMAEADQILAQGCTVVAIDFKP